MTHSDQLPPQKVLHAYRGAVLDASAEIGAVLDEGDDAKTISRVESVLTDPSLRCLLACLPNGIGGTCEALVAESKTFRPSLPSSVANRTMLVRVFLLSQIDAIWWSRTDPFQLDEDITSSPELVELDPLRVRGRLRFRYRRQADGWGGRAGAWVGRRFLPGRQPHTAGLRFARTRPEGVALLNRLGGDCARAIGSDHPPLWVTSLVRSVQHQSHLRFLGYSAFLPSAHCSGHAMDIEVRWFERFGADDTLKSLLIQYQDAGMVNAIDEGQAWHVCVNPAAMEGLRQDFQALVEG